MKKLKIDKESVIVVAIALALLIAWGIYYPQYSARKSAEAAERIRQANLLAEKSERIGKNLQQNPPPAASVQKTVPQVKVSAVHPKEDKTVPVTLENNVLKCSLDLNKGVITDLTLLKYELSNEKKAICLNFAASAWKTFQIEGLSGWVPAKPFSSGKLADGFMTEEVLKKDGATLEVTKQFLLPKDSYSVELHLTLTNPGTKEIILPELKVWGNGLPPMKELAGDKLYNDPHKIEYCPVASQKMVSLDPAMTDEKFAALKLNMPVEWFGASNKYFATLLFASQPFDGGLSLSRDFMPGASKPVPVPHIGGIYRGLTVHAGAPVKLTFRYFSGPKSLPEIKKLPESALSVLHLSYFSWMEALARPMLWFLNYLKGLCGSYGWAIILLTLIVRIVFFPITERANKSMRKMQKLNPVMKEMREKYKDNPKLLNEKMMNLYREEGVNPLGGCFPILLQIPVFFALYCALDGAVELRHVSFLWATDLTKPDLVGPQFLFGYGIHPLVIAMTVLMVVQQKMTPSTMDPAQQKMMMIMPIVMLVMLYNLPSGLTLYWTVSQIFSILQLKYSLYSSKRVEMKNSNNSKTA